MAPLPGLSSSTSKYQITRDASGKIVNGSSISTRAKTTLSSSTRSAVFSSSPRPTRIYAASTSNKALSGAGLERGPDGRLRSNFDASAYRAGNGTSVSRPTVITVSGGGSCNHASNNTNIADIATAALGLATAIKNNADVFGDLNALFKGKTTEQASDTSGKDSLSQMKDCKDSTSLRSAIETAKADKAEIDANLTKLEGGLSAKKEAADAAKEKLEGEKGLNAQVKAQEDVVKQKTDALNESKQRKTEAEATKKRNGETLNTAKEAVGGAKASVDTATTNLANAKSALASTPKETIGPDGTSVPNEPAYSNAQKAVQDAQAELDKAINNLKT